MNLDVYIIASQQLTEAAEASAVYIYIREKALRDQMAILSVVTISIDVATSSRIYIAVRCCCSTGTFL